ncbi:hypothetical protein D3C85_1117100 [compost metagenome]
MVICCCGLSDSAAAMVTISVPRKVNMVVSIAPSTAPKPLGMKPPWANRLDTPLVWLPGIRPMMAAAAMARKAMMATTLTSANQNSNSP